MTQEPPLHEPIPPEDPDPMRAGAEVGPPAPRRLMRSRRDRVIAGVAGGIAEYFDADPALVRIAAVVIAVLTGGLGVVAYLAAWIVMPEEVDVAPGDAVRQASVAQRTRVAFGVGWGIVLIAVGFVWLIAQLDIATPPWQAILSVVLIAVGVSIAVLSRRGLHGGLVLLAIVLSLGLTALASSEINFDGGFGDRSVVVTQPSELEPSYGYAFGSMRIDLRNLELPPGTTEVSLSMAFGDLQVTLPAGAAWRVTSNVFLGSTQGPTFQSDGVVADRDHQSPGYDSAERRLHLRISNAFGSVRVR